MREPTEAEQRAVRVDAALERRGGSFLPRKGDRVLCRKTWRNGAATGDAAVFGGDQIHVGVRWSWLVSTAVVMVPLDELWFP